MYQSSTLLPQVCELYAGHNPASWLQISAAQSHVTRVMCAVQDAADSRGLLPWRRHRGHSHQACAAAAIQPGACIRVKQGFRRGYADGGVHSAAGRVPPHPATPLTPTPLIAWPCA